MQLKIPLLGTKSHLAITRKVLTIYITVIICFILLFLLPQSQNSKLVCSKRIDRKLDNYYSTIINMIIFTFIHLLQLLLCCSAVSVESDDKVTLLQRQNKKILIAKQVEKYRRTAEEIFPPDTEEYFEKFKRFSNHDHNASNKSDHARFKRATILQEGTLDRTRSKRKTLNHESEGTFVINQVNRAIHQHYDGKNAVDINCKQINDQSFVFSIEETSDQQRKLIMHQFNEKTFEQSPLFTTSAPDAVSVDVLNIKGDWFVFSTVDHDPQVAGSTETINTGSSLYRLDLSDNTLEKTQTIHLPFAKSSTLWTGMGEEANQIFLALAPEKSVISSSKTSYSVMVPNYRWQGGYFDFVSQVPASNPQSIQHFSMFSHDYLAIANYQDDTGSTSIQSEIFKYNHKESRFVSFQRIQTQGAKDIRHFTFSNADERRQEHFIAIANNCKRDENGKPQFWTQSTIMKFGSLRFLPFKSFFTYGALQFLPVKDGDKFFLALADFHSIRMFQYNGWTFVETFSQNYAVQHNSPFSISMRHLNSNGKSYFSVATQKRDIENGMFEVNFETRNDHRKLVTSVQAWCHGANIQMGRDLGLLKSQLDSAPSIDDQTVIIKGTLNFVEKVQVGDLRSQTLRMGRNKNLDDDQFKAMAQNEKDFFKFSSVLGQFKHKLNNDVVWATKNNEIDGNVNFLGDVTYQSRELFVKNLHVKETLNSIQVKDHLDNAIFTNKATTLKEIVTDDVIVDEVTVETLNGRKLSDYALRHPTTNQVFTGNNEFLSTVQVIKDIKVGNKFAGLSFTQPQFMINHRNQTFPGVTMELDNVNVKNFYAKMLNGHDIHSMYSDAVHLSGGVIKADKHFTNVKIKDAKVESLNGVNIDSLYQDAIYVKGKHSQVFTGPAHFENLEIEHINPTNPNVNEEFDLSTSFIKVNGGNYKVDRMVVEDSMNIENLFVKSQLNNVKVIKDVGKMDLVMKNSQEPQHIKSKSLKGIHFNENVLANELVDGVDLANWEAVQQIQLTQNEIQGIISTTGNIIAEGGLVTGNSFKQDQFDVLHVLENSALKTSSILPGSCDLHFDSLTVNGNSDIRGSVNKVTPSQWVINSVESEHLDIDGEKTFTEGMHLEKDIKADALFGKVDGANKGENLLEVLPNLLLDRMDQTITPELAFKSIKADVASCPNAILNQVPFENLLLKKGKQVVEVETTFRGPLATKGDVSVLDDMSAALINGIDINHQLKNTLRTKSKNVQTVTASYQFEDMSADKAIVNGLLGSHEVDSFFGDIVQKNSKEIKLNGMSLSFGKGATINSVEFLGRVNEIPSTEWGNAWLLSRGDQTVETKVQFEGPVTAKSFEAPSVNGININELSESILRIDRDEEMAEGSVINFMDTVKVDSVDTVEGVKVNGVDLENDVLLKNRDTVQTIKGANTFTDGMTIKGNLDVNDIEDFDIKNFATLVNGFKESSVETESAPATLTVVGNLILEDEPEFVSKINDMEWSDVMKEFWLKDKDVVLNNQVNFASLTLQNGGTMTDSSTLNGMQLKDFQNNYASKSKPQTWTGKVTLGNVEHVESLDAKSIVLENKGKFNDVDIEEFNESVLKYNGDQEITSSVEVDNVEVDHLDASDDATINSIQVKDFMTISGPNHVTSAKQVKSLKVKTIELSPNTVIDGVNMGEWNDNAVRRTGSFDIKGPLHFASLEATKNVKVDGTVDGIKFDLEHVLTTDKDQEIRGPVTIQGPQGAPLSSALVKAPAGVEFKGTVNNVNVQEGISNMVFPNSNDKTPIIIKGPTVFNGDMVLSQVKTEDLVQGHNGQEVAEKMKRARDEIHSKAFIASDQYGELLQMTNKMIKSSERRAIFLDFFVLTQTIQAPVTYVKALHHVGYPAIAIGFKKSKSTTTENWWSYNSALDYYQLQIGNRVQLEGVVTDIAELTHDGNSVFAFAVNNEEGDQPAQAAVEVMDKSKRNFDMDKSPDKLSKTFITKFVGVGTPNMRPAISQVIHSSEFKSVQSFTVTGDDELTSCMVATTNPLNELDSSVKIFCMDKEHGMLSAIQEMQMDSPSLTTSTTIEKTDTTLLGFLTRSVNERPEGLLEIWTNSQSNAIEFTKQSCLPVFNAISLDSLSTPDGKTILTVASGALRGSEYQGSVFVYRYSSMTHQFKKIQTIEANHPIVVKLQFLKPSRELVLYILSQTVTNNVQVYKRQGLSGWNLVHQFTTEDAKSLEVTDFTVDGIYRAQLLVTSPTQTNVYAAEFMGMNTLIEEEIMESSQNSMSSLREFINFDNL